MTVFAVLGKDYEADIVAEAEFAASIEEEKVETL